MECMSWNRKRLRHAAHFFWRWGGDAAVPVYESLGPEFPLALAPGWLNLGLWENVWGDPAEAEAACVRLVETLAEAVPEGGDILDVANGLGSAEPVISRVARPRSLTALNITELQLRAGRGRLAAAGARPVLADAVRLPIASGSMDGIISVEAAFHFVPRLAFFREAHRVLRSGGVLAITDVPIERRPRTPAEAVAGLGQLRLWGVRLGAIDSSRDIARAVERAGFEDVHMTLCGDRVIDPAARFARRRLPYVEGLSLPERAATRAFLRHIELLRRKGIVEYILLTARRP